MHHLTKDSATQHKNNENCDVVEYPFENEKHINTAVIKLTGRYPSEGYVFNEVCTEQAYVAEGSGTITTSNGTLQLASGDMVLIQPYDKYFFDGKMTLIVSASPAWYPEQHHTTPKA